MQGLTGTVVELAVSGSLHCARTNGGSAWCWGQRRHPRDPHVGALSPRRVPVQGSVAGLFVDADRIWALMSDGVLVSWDGGPSVARFDHPARIERLATTRDQWCIRDFRDIVSCWRSGHPETAREVLRDVVQLESGAWHHCALMRDRTVRCWGANSRAQLGDGTQQDSAQPVVVWE